MDSDVRQILLPSNCGGECLAGRDEGDIGQVQGLPVPENNILVMITSQFCRHISYGIMSGEQLICLT